MKSDFAQAIFEANKRRYEIATNPLRSHGPDHHWRVCQYALSLADKLDVFGPIGVARIIMVVR